MQIEKKIHVSSDLDIVIARMQARNVAKKMGFGTMDQARISLAASELARALCDNADGPKELIMSDAHQNGFEGLQISCLVNLEHAPTRDKKDWAKEPSTVGRSLSGACLLVDESFVEGQGGEHIRITLTKWLKKN